MQGGLRRREVAACRSPRALIPHRVLGLTWQPAGPHQPPARSQSEQQAQMPAHGRRAHARCGLRRVRACGARDARSGRSASAPVCSELRYRSGSGATQPARRTS